MRPFFGRPGARRGRNLWRERRPGLLRRLAQAGGLLREGLLRDNKVLPAVLAVLAVLILAWVLADTLRLGGGGDGGGPEEQPIREQANLAQAPGENAAPEGTNPQDPETPAPGTENRDAESFAVYESKDPFRDILQPADSGEDDGNGDDGTDTGDTDDTTDDTTDSDGDGAPDATDSAPDDPTIGGTGGTGADLDGDGLPDANENDGDLDDDGTPDADDPDTRDSDADGTPDSQDSTPDGTGAGGQYDDQYDEEDPGVAPPASPPPAAPAPPAPADPNDDLFDSGGVLPVP